MAKLQDFWIEGTLAAPLTPFKENGDLNPDIMDKYVDFMVDQKIDGVFALGTMGEGMSLTVEERKQVAEAWVRVSKNKLKYVIMQVGTENLRSSKELARHAQSVGVTAISCFGPSFYKPRSVDSLVDYIAEVAAAAPDTPIYLYDINFITGIYLNTTEFLEKAKDRIPNLRGAKISSRELPATLDAKNCCGGKFQILSGSDEQLITILSLGVDVPVVNAYVGSLFDKLRAAFRKGNIEEARKEQNKARMIFKIAENNGGGAPAAKAIMKMLGLDLGPARRPQQPITEEQRDNLKKQLKAIGFLKE